MDVNDFIVVGSGFCGVMSAKTLVDAGVKVTMLDAGVFKKGTLPNTESNFIDIREKDPEQHDFFLGQNFESLYNIQQKNPIHLTPNRKFTTERVNEFLTWVDGEFNPIESLARGGLGNAWGLGSYVYSENELKEAGLNPGEMKNAYEWVASKIGISGGNDESTNYSNAGLFKPQKAIPADFNGASLIEKAKKNQPALSRLGFTIGRAPLAVSTESNMNGSVYKEDDLDFYNTENSSAYRPNVTLNELLKKDNFIYKSDCLVLKFKKVNDHIEVEVLNMVTREYQVLKTKKLILAAGALGTARIVMRSEEINKMPVICNPYSYMPSMQLKHIGSKNTGYQTGLAQLSIYYDKDKAHTKVAMGSVYSYRALMGFRLLREFPIDYKNGIKILKLLQPALNITGIFHPEYGSKTKYIERVADTNSPTHDSMRSRYTLSEKEELELNNTEKAFKKALRKLGCIPLNVYRNDHGASIHYGGTIPFSDKTEMATLNKDGGLNGYENVFVADGSGFRFLSGKGLTLSLMAYAHLTAKKALGKI